MKFKKFLGWLGIRKWKTTEEWVGPGTIYLFGFFHLEELKQKKQICEWSGAKRRGYQLDNSKRWYWEEYV